MSLSSLPHLDAGNGKLAAATLAYYWQKYGYGPTWSEFADLMDWPKRNHDQIIRQLAREGWVKFTNSAPNSLRPGKRDLAAYERYQRARAAFKAARKQAREAAGRD